MKKLKKLLAVMMASAVVLAMCPTAVAADGLTTVAGSQQSGETSGTCGPSATWTLEDGTLTISGTGKLEEIKPDLSNRNDVKKVVIPEGITSIGKKMFGWYENVSELIIPDSVEEIGAAAFAGWKGLTNIKLSNRITKIEYDTFLTCSSLPEVTIPDSVSSIGERAFMSCEELKKVNIPKSVTAIEYLTFFCCRNLPEIELPDGVTRIGFEAFAGCNNLVKVNIPKGVTEIEEMTFAQCGELPAIELPDGVTRIGLEAFEGCSKLVKINIPKSVTKIEYKTFHGCSSLPEVVIPSSVTTLEEKAFEDCTAMSTIHFTGNAPEFAEDAFLNVTATVYYPLDNATWTADKMQNYGGNLTWQGRESLRIIPELTDSIYLIGSGKGATIKCSGELKDFVSVAVDGVVLDPSYYTVEEGSTVLTILSSYLDTLSVGDHVVTLNYKYGSVDTVLKVVDHLEDADKTGNSKKLMGNSPKTGDESATMLWVFVGLTAAGFGSIAWMKKRKTV